MMVNNRGSVLGLLRWQWRHVAAFVATAAAVAFCYRVLGLRQLTLPSFPVVVIGGAVGIFVSFRTNSAYDRWWEGRKLWGSLVNASRHFASQVLAYLPPGEGGMPSAVQARLVRRHIAYVHALKRLLRRQDAFVEPEVVDNLPDDELPRYRAESNLTHAILDRQLADLAALARAGTLDERRLESLDLTVRALLDVQGGCERIKNTPMPRGYGFIAERLILLFGLLFPFAVVEEVGWWVVPLNVAVCLSFALISEAGRVLEDPFTLFWNGLPLQALSTTIEVNLRQRLGEPREELPPLPVPDSRGILM